MEKILLVVFGSTAASHALNFACHLSGITRLKLKGLFINIAKYEETPVIKQVYGMPYVETIVAGDLAENAQKKQDVKKNIQVFTDTCKDNGILASVHLVKGRGVAEIIEESRFADIILVDAGAAYNEVEKEPPAAFLRKLLPAVQCPIIITPATQHPIEEVVICYNGSPDALFAMKQFAYILPELSASRATIVQVKEGTDIDVEEKKRIMDWLSRHYSYADYTILKGDTAEELVNFLQKKKHAMVVMGAYGRNWISRFFKPSQADMLISALAYPVFITHY